VFLTAAHDRGYTQRMELSPERGAVTLTLDRPYILLYAMRATDLLRTRFGPNYLAALYTVNHGNVEITSMEALAYYLWAGLREWVRQTGEEITLEEAENMVRPFTEKRVGAAVLTAVTRNYMAPLPKAEVHGAPGASGAVDAGPGSTKISTSSRRSASPTASSAGRRRASGRRP
jgi:hypothetical protein